MIEDAGKWAKDALDRIVKEHKAGARAADFPPIVEQLESPHDKAMAQELAESQPLYESLLKPDWLRMNNRVDLYSHFQQAWNLMLRYNLLFTQSEKKNRMVQARILTLQQILKEIYERKGKDLEKEYIHIHLRIAKEPREEALKRVAEQWQQTALILQKGLDGFPI